MRRARCSALLAMAMMIAMAGALPAGSASQAGASKTGQAKAGKAPTNTRAAKRAELARRREEFEEKLIAQEKQAWEEERKQNADFFREAMTAQFVTAEPDGKRYSKEEVLRLIPTAGMTSYELTDFRVIRAGRDAAVITYRATVNGSVKGKETPTKVLATTVWVHRGAAWKMTFHQKTVVSERQ